MIVRELITLLGVELDDTGVRKVDTAVSRFEDRMRKVGRFIGGSIFLAGFARATGAAVKFASDARETLNLVRESFGANAADVEAWSTSVAREVGRSEFLMRELAGTLGALLTPLMDGNTEAAAEMSTQLATLAVDLASFFNVAEKDALIALRAGISGETEPLKRLGVVLTEVGLQEQARREGLTKSVKTMSVAEKTALRFRTIMHQTANAQGDAARTANEYANASRAMSDGFRDVATRIGDRLLPLATRFVIWMRDAARSLVELSEKTRLFEAALIVVGSAVAALAVLLIAPWAGFIAIAALATAAVVALTLAVDDLLVFFGGGKSVVGEFIDELFGIGAAQQYVDDYKVGLDLIGAAFDSVKKSISAGVDTITEKWNRMDKAMRDSILGSLIQGALTTLGPVGTAAGIAGRFLGLFDTGDVGAGDEGSELRNRRRSVGRGTDSEVVTARKGSTGAQLRLQRARELEAKRASGKKLTRRENLELSRIVDHPEGPLVPESYNERRRREIAEARAARAAARAHRLDPALEAARARTRAREEAFTFDFASAPARGRRGGGDVTATVHAPVTINGATDPAAVERAVQRGLERALEDAGAALAEGAQ